MQLIVVLGAFPIEGRPDALVVVVAAALLLTIAVAASALPARRVARVVPTLR
jgi:hypothetical protein